jgi:hypothetical protein
MGFFQDLAVAAEMVSLILWEQMEFLREDLF